MSLIDFTNAKIDLGSKYGGSDQKRSILYNNERYMIKMSDRIPDEKRTVLNSSYTNSAFSEYICCHIIESMGIPVQDTLLGQLEVVSSHTGKPVVHPVVAFEHSPELKLRGFCCPPYLRQLVHLRIRLRLSL